MITLEENLIRRLGIPGWVLYWLPRMHTLSKVYSVSSPPYRKEGHLLAKKIDNEVDAVHRRMKTDLDKRKNLPISNIKRLSRDQYQRKIAEINRKRTAQKANFLRDKIREASTAVELNLIFDAFDAGMGAFASGDYQHSDGGRFCRAYIEQDRPPEGSEKLASLYHEVRSEVKKRRRDWVPDESKYIEHFIRGVKAHYMRLFKVAFWDGVEYLANLEGSPNPVNVDGRKMARARELSPGDISRIMDILYFKFEHHPMFPVKRTEYESIKKAVTGNYDFPSQIKSDVAEDGVARERYAKPAITSIR